MSLNIVKDVQFDLIIENSINYTVEILCKCTAALRLNNRKS